MGDKPGDKLGHKLGDKPGDKVGDNGTWWKHHPTNAHVWGDTTWEGRHTIQQEGETRPRTRQPTQAHM